MPYSEDVKWLIRQHLVALTDAYPSLQPKTATFTHNDGRSINLLQAEGTVPMVYQGVTYNIPITIWLMESYPRQPPVVYVTPTRDMIIKRPHSHVNPSGMVTIPYLINWIYPSSNLVDLARNLSHYFGRDPPLYSQRRNTNPNPSPNLSASNSSANSVISSSSVGNTGFPAGSMADSPSAARPSIPPRSYPPSPYGTSGRIPPPLHQRPPPGVGTDNPNEVYKRNAINKLVDTVHGDIVGLRKTREAEMDGLFSAQAAIRERGKLLNNGLKEMQDEKEGLEQQLQTILMNADVMEGWLRDNQAKVSTLGNLDIDNAFEPCDILSKQMLECTASDLAIEDVVYSLDKAAQEGAIPFDQYLRNIRMLSREQFFHRATSAKVRSAQMQAQVASMASRAAQYTM